MSSSNDRPAPDGAAQQIQAENMGEDISMNRIIDFLKD